MDKKQNIMKNSKAVSLYISKECDEFAQKFIDDNTMFNADHKSAISMTAMVFTDLYRAKRMEIDNLLRRNDMTEKVKEDLSVEILKQFCLAFACIGYRFVGADIEDIDFDTFSGDFLKFNQELFLTIRDVEEKIEQ